ncbi:MAG: hypothetical protein ACR2LX_11485 [Jatrophihabitans sp.]
MGAPEPSSAVVGAALERLNALPGLPLVEHPGAYQGIHTALQRALAEIDNP